MPELVRYLIPSNMSLNYTSSLQIMILCLCLASASMRMNTRRGKFDLSETAGMRHSVQTYQNSQNDYSKST
jgi:hypothetical protein